MKIAIDCRLIGSSGIGTFIENVVNYMVKYADHSYVLIGNPDYLATYRYHSHCQIITCTHRSFSLKELLFFPVGIINQCDAFYTPNFNVPLGIHVPIYSTIHDIVMLDTEHFNNRLKRFITKLYLRHALYISNTVFTVSKFSQERIRSTFKTNTSIKVVPNGISNELRTYANNHLETTWRKGIVFLGNLKKHKGLSTLIQAFDLLVRNGLAKQLTVIGRFDFRTKDKDIIKVLKTHHEHIRFVSNASNSDVFHMVSEAELLVSPSLYEGFGIPPLEAMYLGTPVIISNIPAYQEIYRDLPVTFFKAGDAKDLFEKIRDHSPHALHIRGKIDKLYNYQMAAKRIIDVIYEQRHPQ